MPLRDLEIPDLVGDFERSLKAEGKSPKTIRGYTTTANLYVDFLAEKNLSRALDFAAQRANVRDFMVDQIERHTPSTAATRYRYLQQFWRWVVAEGEMEVSPMTGMSPPTIPDVPPPIFEPWERTALIKACDGKEFEDRRDMAIMRLWDATGVRLGEMVSMRTDGLARDEQAVLVVGKGDKSRWVPYGAKSAAALDRYLRMRRRHDHADSEALWIGRKGALTESGLYQMLERRARKAGVKDAHPHRWRHDVSHRTQLDGMSESDLMEIMGWSSVEMPRRYGRSAAAERARAAYRRLDIET